jgi:hypothetical protein
MAIFNAAWQRAGDLPERVAQVGAPLDLVCGDGGGPGRQWAVRRGAASAGPFQAMAIPLPVQQKYRDVREGERPGEGIALAGGID